MSVQLYYVQMFKKSNSSPFIVILSQKHISRGIEVDKISEF